MSIYKEPNFSSEWIVWLAGWPANSADWKLYCAYDKKSSCSSDFRIPFIHTKEVNRNAFDKPYENSDKQAIFKMKTVARVFFGSFSMATDKSVIIKRHTHTYYHSLFHSNKHLMLSPHWISLFRSHTRTYQVHLFIQKLSTSIFCQKIQFEEFIIRLNCPGENNARQSFRLRTTQNWNIIRYLVKLFFLVALLQWKPHTFQAVAFLSIKNSPCSHFPYLFTQFKSQANASFKGWEFNFCSSLWVMKRH